MQTMDNFKINTNDAAITFSQDGTINLFLPKHDTDYMIDPNKDPHVFTAVAIMTSMNEPAFNEIINNKISFLLAQAEAMVAAQANGPCGGCPGAKEDGCACPSEAPEKEEGCCGGECSSESESVTSTDESNNEDPHGG